MRNRGNLNNHIGLPLSLLELQTGRRGGGRRTGNEPRRRDLRRLVAIAEPDVRVWTNVGTAHLGFFGVDGRHRRGQGRDPRGCAARRRVFVANADDPRVMARVRRIPGPGGDVRRVGPGRRARRVSGGPRRRRAGGRRCGRRAGTLRARAARCPGAATWPTCWRPRAVALQFGVPLDAIADRAATLVAAPPPGRGPAARRAGSACSTTATTRARGRCARTLETIGATAVRGRKIAVLGEMLELGAHSAALHRECGRAASACGRRALLTVGGAAGTGARARPRVEAGLAADLGRHTSPTATEAAAPDRGAASATAIWCW